MYLISSAMSFWASGENGSMLINLLFSCSLFNRSFLCLVYTSTNRAEMEQQEKQITVK